MVRLSTFAFTLAIFLSVQLEGLTGTRPAHADDVIKIGVLHSLTGPLAISETSLRDVMMMLIDGQNRKGGLLGRQIEPVVLDPASDPETFAVKLRQLLAEQEVAAVFGGWTSSSRKAMLPVLKELNGLLYYPVQYEGQESERNVFYTGAVPNQQAMPAVDYLMHLDGVRKWFLVGSDYVYPQVTNRILKAYLTANAVAEEDIVTRFIPFNFKG